MTDRRSASLLISPLLFAVICCPSLASVDHRIDPSGDRPAPPLLFNFQSPAPAGGRPSQRDVPENRCYCNYGPTICMRPDNKCIKHSNASCFHSVRQVYNYEAREIQTQHWYGCTTLEPGSDRSDMTCNGWRIGAAFSIACCPEGNECNRDIQPPPLKHLAPQSATVQDPWFVKTDYLAHLAFFAVTSTLLALCLVGLVCRRRFTNERKRKRHLLSLLKVDGIASEDLLKGGGGSYNTDDTTIVEQSDASGSFGAFLNERTIAHQLNMGDVIGRGRFGEVRVADWRGSSVAVKSFYTTEEESWRNERDIYTTQMLNHQHILQFVAADITELGGWTQLLLVTDFHELGSLADFLRTTPALTLQQALKIAFSVASGLAHLHGNVIGTAGMRKPMLAHRDLKSKNVLVKSRDGDACIADFGLAVRFDGGEMTPSRPRVQVGTKRYMAPEILNGTLSVADIEQLQSADVYAMALVFWEIARRVELPNIYSSGDVDPENGGVPAAGLANRDDSSSGYASSEATGGQAARRPPLNAPKSWGESEQPEYWLARPWTAPFDGLVRDDPSLEEMQRVVVDEAKRPPISEPWRDPSLSVPFPRFVSIMEDCWAARAPIRHSALKVKIELSRLTRGDLQQRIPSTRLIPTSTYS